MNSLIAPLPLFFPPIRYVRTVAGLSEYVATTREICLEAGVACRASGLWCERKILWTEGEDLTITATPGYRGDVFIVLPKVIAREPWNRACWLLGVMAYAIFDGVARESIRAASWRRIAPTVSPYEALRPTGVVPGVGPL